MNEATFWTTIEKASKLGKRSEDETCEALFEALTKLKAKDIAAFDQIMHQQLEKAYSWKLWGAAYVLQGGCGDDGFLHFRLWLIAQGKATFEATLANPDATLAAMNFEEPDLETAMEGLLYVAADAFDETATDADELPESEMSEEPQGKAFDFEDEHTMSRAYPLLLEKYAASADDEDDDEGDDEGDDEDLEEDGDEGDEDYEDDDDADDADDAEDQDDDDDDAPDAGSGGSDQPKGPGKPAR
jgi:hypothetical protein